MFSSVRQTSLLALSASLLVPTALAQTWTACNPLERTDCPADPAFGTNHTWTFTNTTADLPIWNTTAGKINYGDDGASFTVAKKGDAPTFQSSFYIFFGEVEVWLKAASGQGIISSIVLESDDLDEVDWEIMGGDTKHVESNYFGKGNTTDYTRAKYHEVDTAPQDGFHNYTTRWTAEKIEWFIDGSLVRTLNYKDANDGKNFPQTPMNVRIGIWAGGDSSLDKDTIEWAGGVTDYSKGPYTMYVNKMRVNDYSQGKEYTFGDKTGSWQSIKTVSGISAAAEELNKPPAQTITQRWNALPSNTRTGIAIGIAVFLGLVACLLTWCCVRQRKVGKRERQTADAMWDKSVEENRAYKEYANNMRTGRFSGNWGKGNGYIGVKEVEPETFGGR